ncbi:substrate-binding domain-containing protein [Ligilactobacillus sp. Marseille-Q7487]|uniref:GntR family transcriptional regulator n=1 Tax=Ligilactobacillus sp. Marseille-Q7487 TaxID=3022128 RepID=UPI0015B429D9|nr:substrate-binding domain-containing protein [Ligilactobacillus sp. Marseille-Q7487]
MAKYQEIYEKLRLAVLRGEYAPDQQLPSENALSLKYGVSRITSKHALNKLEENGLIYRIQGKGSFVKPHVGTNSRKLLLVLPFAGDLDLGNYLSGIQQTLTGTTWQLLSIQNSAFLNMDIDKLLTEYAGIIYYPQNLTLELPYLLQLYLAKKPLVLLDKEIAHLGIPSVTSDNNYGGQIAVEHLAIHGYQRIAFFAKTPFWEDFSGTVAARFFGYLNAYRTFCDRQSTPLSWTQQMAQLEENELISYLKEQNIQALIAENDIVALRLGLELKKNGLKIPEDIALIGFDDLPMAQLFDPPLTSIGQDFYELGQNAVDLLLTQINDPARLLNQHQTVPVKLVARQSTLKE